MWPPIGIGLSVLLCFSAVYEPVRLALLYGQSKMEVGGVGGVGGLVNLGNPGAANCVHDFEGKYCYEKGMVGPFTAFACLILACWVGALFVACVLQSILGGKTPSIPAEASAPPPHPSSNFWIYPVWISLNVVWFMLPFVAFGLGMKEIEGRFARAVLTLALAAAHPLSWSLALVMIPVGGIIPRLMDRDSLDLTWFQFHRLVGYTATFWALLHGFGELAYLVASKRLVHDLNIHANGENLIYWAGILSLVIMVAHFALVCVRKRLQPFFHRIHSILAALLLLAAAFHWWPFALFFVPATSVEGVALASRLWDGQPSIAGGSSHGERRPLLMTLSSCQAATALTLSLMGSLMGLSVVWMCREKYMVSTGANLRVPFVFPPLSVAASTSVSVLTSWVYFAFFTHRNMDMHTGFNLRNDQNRTESELPSEESEIHTILTPLLGTDEI